MANYGNLSSLFTAIADAIRAKTGGTETIVADNFPAEIAAIETGGGGSDTVSVTFTNVDGTIEYWDENLVFQSVTLGTTITAKVYRGVVRVTYAGVPELTGNYIQSWKNSQYLFIFRTDGGTLTLDD